MPQDYDYGQLIDDFELDADVMPGETLTEYIERRRREFDSKADGGLIGIEVLFGPKRGEYQTGGQAYNSRATTQDFAKALRSVSAGTTYQQQADAKRYARQQADEMLRSAMRSADPNKGPGLQGIYDTFFKGKATGVGPTTFTPGGSGIMMSFASKERDNILDAMANQMLNTTQYSQSKVNERREKEYADFMNNLIASTYGKADDYRAEAMTLGMPTEAYFDYLVTSDPKDVMTSYATLSRDPYFDPKTYVPTDYSNPETPRPPSPYEVYFQEELQRQTAAGIPVGQRIQKGQVIGLPTALPGPGSQMGPGYESYADVVARNKKMLGLKDGGRVGMISGGFLKGIGSLFKGGKDKIDDIIETKSKEYTGFRSRDDIPLSTYSEMKGPIKISEMENIPKDQLEKILNTQRLGLYEETPEILKAANLLQRFTKKVGGKRVIDYERAEDILNVKLKGNETLDELFEIEFRTRPEMRADGGRVGLFMGGPALEGQALSIYESMNAYGFSDQEIANTLEARGIYTPNKTTTTTPVINKAPNIINQGDDGDDSGKREDTITSYDPNVNLGPNKDVIDYEADAYGIGPTFKGQLARAYIGLKSLPTPFNIASRAIGNISDFFKQKAAEKKAKEEAAAEAAAQQAFNEIMSQGNNQQDFYDSLNEGRGSTAVSGNPNTSGAGDAPGYAGPTTFAKGGLATMFTRRR